MSHVVPEPASQLRAFFLIYAKGTDYSIKGKISVVAEGVREVLATGV